MSPLGVILLAAGLGKRMRSDLPKVAHPIGGKPLISFPLRAARSLSPERIAVVVGYGEDKVRRACGDEAVTWVRQNRQSGTGHAVRCAEEVFHGFPGELLILSGDVPFISCECLAGLVGRHREGQCAVTLLTASVQDPSGYGRILRDGKGEVAEIVEDRDAFDSEREIKEINAGIYAANPKFLFSALEGLSSWNEQGEYYLPDVVEIACRQGRRVGTVQVKDAREILGVNTREELAFMEKALQEKINRKWLEAGVTLKDPGTTYIEEEVSIGKDTVIGPNTHLMGKTKVGERCLIDGSAYVTNCRLRNGVHLMFSVVLSDCDLDEGVKVGPFAHLRPGTNLQRDVHIGSFVEVKNSTVGEGTKANHLSYIGDATLGRETNIGAGTITCNYDGLEKHRTTIGDHVQVGSNSQLVAPVEVGDDAYIGAGSTITKDVPAGSLALSRAGQENMDGWVQRFREKHKKKDG